MVQHEPTTLWWVRRDLRLADNPALAAALANGARVVPVFILDPSSLNSRYHRGAEKRLAFLYDGLRQLDGDLRERGGRLIVRRGQPLSALRALLRETGAAAVFAEEDYSPYARRRDAGIAAQLPLHLVKGLTVHHPTEVAKANGDPYTVFTPFSRAWQALRPPSDADLLPAPPRLKLLAGLASEAVPRGQAPTHFLAGEGHARATLRTFTEGAIFRYGEMRDRLDSDGTSALSPYLRFGMISAREVVVAARRTMWAVRGSQRESAEKWLNELIWREFYCAILYHFPEVLQHAFRPELRDVAWANDPDAFAAWREGRTGYPVVDAAMRQLAATGWMPNRARMITASFLVKDLLIDWRWGERWFMQHLIDGDLAANSGGWQWVAGAGADAAPYFRVFNPTLQARKFDPYGDFSRAWVRELRAVPDQYVHEPWTMPAEVQRQARCFIGQDYPAPIIEHAFARQRTLAAYRRPRPAGQASR